MPTITARIAVRNALLLQPVDHLQQVLAEALEQIEVQGLYRMTREAFLHALGIKVGDAAPTGPRPAVRAYPPVNRG